MGRGSLSRRCWVLGRHAAFGPLLYSESWALNIGPTSTCWKMPVLSPTPSTTSERVVLCPRQDFSWTVTLRPVSLIKRRHSYRMLYGSILEHTKRLMIPVTILWARIALRLAEDLLSAAPHSLQPLLSTQRHLPTASHTPTFAPHPKTPSCCLIHSYLCSPPKADGITFLAWVDLSIE